MDKVKIGVLGAGRGAGLAKSMALAPSAELYALCDMNEERMAAAVDASIFATDMADLLVEKGLPFRKAHGIVAGAVRCAESSGRPLDGLTIEERRALHPALAALPEDLFDPRNSVRRKKTYGSTHPALVKMQIEKARGLLAAARGESS